MPDIREILAALDIDDRALWSEQRTIMRRSYLNAHNETVGIGKWTHEDDAFMDLIDIRLALLFDRAGRLQATTDIIGSGEEIIKDLYSKDDVISVKSNGAGATAKISIDASPANTLVHNLAETQMSEASRLLADGFTTEWKQ